MPIGQAVQQLGTIDPSSLIGRADTSIVEPRATAMLADAFRQGVITADDVIARVGELGKTKRKAELQVAQEATSPEAQALRAQQLTNASAAGDLQAQQIEQQKVLLQYPAIAYFQKLAPAAGITEPKLSDGTPDYPQMEKIGAELAVHQARKGEATAQLENITTQESADGTVLFARTKQGEFVDPKKLQQLRSQATRTFERQAPGTVQSAATAPAPVEVEARAPVSTENIEVVRARLANTFGPETIVALPEDQVRRLDVAEKEKAAEVTPRFSSPAAAAPSSIGSPVGGGISLGASGAARQGMASEQQKGLAQAALTREQLKSVADSFTRVQQEAPWLTGPVMGRLSALTAPENWNVARADFARATTAILANLAKGIYHETGVLSDKDIARYQKALPNANDTADVAQVKLDGVTRDIFNSIDTNIETLRGQGQTLTPIIQGMQDAARVELQKLNSGRAPAAAAKPASAGQAPVVSLPSGRRVTRDASGQYRYVE